MSQAKAYQTRMMQHLATDSGAAITVAAGIVKLTFEDGSVLDFTHPEVVNYGRVVQCDPPDECPICKGQRPCQHG